MAKKKLIPEYNFSLGKDAQASSSTIRNIYDKIDNSEKSFYQRISELKNNQSNNNISMTDIIRNFIRKNVDDSVSGEISFNKGIKSANYTPGLGGVGFRMYNDDNGKGILDIDNINVREAIYTTVLTYNKVNSVGGSIVISAAWCTVLRSEISGSGDFRMCTVWFKPEGYSAQHWAIGDQVRMQRGLDKMLYTFVKDVSIEPNENGEYWIDLYMGYNPTSKIGDSTPLEGDVLVQWGNRDPLASQNRKNIIIISSGDGGSEYPYIEQYVGVDSFDLSNKLMARISSDVYFGSPDKSKYLWWNKDDNGEFLIKGVLTQSPSDDTSPLPVWRGEWDNETEYFAGDLVSFDGTTYICIEQTNAGDDPTDEYYWSVYASAGADGETGSVGQSVRYSNWINGNTYFAGNINDGGTGNNPNRYIDYVTFESGGIVRAYKCKSYHIASAGINSPDVSTTYWEQVSYFPVIASNLVLANQAVIGGFVFSEAIDASGNAIPAEQQEIRTSDDPINPAIRLRGDGSGHLAKGNISWNSNGTRIDINGNIVSKSGEIGGLKIYNNSLESKNMSFTEGDIEQILELKTPSSEYFPYSSTCYADGVFSPGNLIHAYTDNIYIPFNGYIELRIIRTKASPNLPAYDTAYTIGSRIDLTDVYGNVVASIQLTSLSEPNYITIPISTGTYIIHAYSGANKVIPVGGGTYKIGEPVYSSVEIKGNSTDGIYAYGISRCTKIGNNGIYSFFGSENYLHFSEDYGMEIQANTAIYSPNGQYGIRITNIGIEKTSNYGASWSPI